MDNLKYLGNVVSNQIDGGQLDIKQKMAKYIDRNCNINEEFNFAHPSTKIKINSIFNCHFSGSQTWNLFSKEALTFESTYNRSVKVMAELPFSTHRYLIEAVTDSRHMKIKLIRDYLGFIRRIKESPKFVLRQLYQLVKYDVTIK